jgi:hypothetical protein
MLVTPFRRARPLTASAPIIPVRPYLATALVCLVIVAFLNGHLVDRHCSAQRISFSLQSRRRADTFDDLRFRSADCARLIDPQSPAVHALGVFPQSRAFPHSRILCSQRVAEVIRVIRTTVRNRFRPRRASGQSECGTRRRRTPRRQSVADVASKPRSAYMI